MPYCGTGLVSDHAHAKASPSDYDSDILKRLFLTISLVFVYRLLALIPLPFIDHDVLGGVLSQEGFFGNADPRFSIVSLGIMPYVSAYMLVEILSLIIRPMKAWREQGSTGRAKLFKAALLLTLLVAFIQSFGVAVRIEKLAGSDFQKILGSEFRITTMLTLTATAFLVLWIAHLITKNGIGHGISVLIITGLVLRFLQTKVYSPSLPKFDVSGTLPATAAFALALIALTLFIEKSTRNIPVSYKDGTKAAMPIKLTSAGILPAHFSAKLIMFPITMAALNPTAFTSRIVEFLLPGSLLYMILTSLFILFCYFFLTAVFYDPMSLSAFLKKKNAFFTDKTAAGTTESPISKALLATAFTGTIYLCFMVLIPTVNITWLHLSLGGVSLIIAVTIVLDLTAEFSFRKKQGRLVKAAEFHDIPKAGLAKSVLEGKGIPCHLRGYYHRALLYFFGPYIEVSVLVPEGREQEARAVIETYIGE